MKAILALEDGTLFHGQSFTGPGDSGGEVIFNTGMSGYQEVLTDPSYAGQMVVMTYPLIGNYGINPVDVESDRIWVEAFIVKECCKQPSNWRATMSLPDYLREQGVMGIEGVDTRALTRHIRIQGAMRGFMSTEVDDPAALIARARALPAMEGQGLADKVTASGPYAWKDGRPSPVTLESDGSYAWPGPGPRVLVYDFGIKWNILRLLAEQGLDLLVVPSGFTAKQAAATGAQAIFLSNGPGDPAALPQAIEAVAELSKTYPMAGICLGHQILGHALGGKTFKLPFGHHGLNHPVKDLATGRIEISSQNHGFCVDLTGLDGIEPTHINLNDQTLEGFAHKTRPLMAIQFHPEANPGPHDSQYFFRRFRDMVRKEVGC